MIFEALVRVTTTSYFFFFFCDSDKKFLKSILGLFIGVSVIADPTLRNNATNHPHLGRSQSSPKPECNGDALLLQNLV